MSPWNERYAREGWAFGTEPNDFLKAEAHRIPEGGRVLCLGEGEGRNGVHLASLGYRVVAVDQSAVGMHKARALAAERGVSVETLVASVEELDLGEGEWQGIVSIFFHLPPDLRRAVHRRVARGLARGGVFVLEAYTPGQLELGTGGPPHVDRLPTLAVLREELESLELVVGRELEREIREGWMHTGRGAVVQVVGVRP
jgi:SAM-dependent methyltransferase